MKPWDNELAPLTEAAEDEARSKHLDWGGCDDWCTDAFPCHTCQAGAAVTEMAGHARELERRLRNAERLLKDWENATDADDWMVEAANAMDATRAYIAATEREQSPR